jgi:hypothetical protein
MIAILEVKNTIIFGWNCKKKCNHFLQKPDVFTIIIVLFTIHDWKNAITLLMLFTIFVRKIVKNYCPTFVGRKYFT